MSSVEQSEINKSNFIRTIINKDLEQNKNDSKVITRFPPEPNGYLHIGHAKSICLNFGLSMDYPNAKCHLRFDDTNPEKENEEFVESIKKDVKWLGFDWKENLFHASDYFEKLYGFAVELIKKDRAYVCELNQEQMRETRGTLKEPGKDSPFRNRPIEESLKLFQEMREGKYEDGKLVLRAKIDMGSPNIKMRDPVIYRIKKTHHQRTGDQWCIYPMYDFTHCLSDMLEGITHSLCTLEFEDHRPLYDWVLNELETPCHPQQIEFARLNLEYCVMSKRKLMKLVEDNHVSGWDDPRMPTISGMRNRGFTPESIRSFCEKIGISKKESTIGMEILEECVREDLNQKAPRVMGVLDPLKVTITNFSTDKEEVINAPYHPKDESFGSRDIYFTNEIYIEKTDFMMDAPKKFFRLAPDREVRLRYGYVIKCNEVITSPETGEVIELKCTYDPETGGGKTPDGRKVKGIIHWVPAKKAIKAQVNLYDRLFKTQNPNVAPEGEDFTYHINENSLSVLKNCFVEPSLSSESKQKHFQFERQGYFYLNDDQSNSASLCFNRVVTLRDTWAKMQKK